MSFKTLGLSAPLVTAVEEQGYEVPSPIQIQAIPAILEGKDVMAVAQTGTGKTAGFTLPLLDRLSKGGRPRANQARALILTPTRELAAQVAESVATYGRHLNLRSQVVFGGVKINPQMKLLRSGCDILVATPGRLIDLYQQNAVKFNELEVLVLDEADRMLDMGFIHDIKRIISFLPKQRQNLMFSATFSGDIRALAKGLMHHPIEISISPEHSTATTVEQWVYTVDKKRKPELLTDLIRKQGWDQALVFTKTKHGANKLTQHLEKEGITAGAIHGNKSQSVRTKTLAKFKAGELRILVATDIAARGLDINQLPQVVNFDLPTVPEDYVHRIGRTGRAGATGKAISLVCADEVEQLFDIERVIKKTLKRELVDGFEPVHDVPTSRGVSGARSGAHGSKRHTQQAKTTRYSGSRTHHAHGGSSKPDGSRFKSDGPSARSDGSRSKPSGPRSKPERSWSTSEGGRPRSDGSRSKPERSWSTSEGGRPRSDGSRSKPSGPRSKPEGSWSTSEGGRPRSDGSRSKPSGPRSKPEGSWSSSEGGRPKFDGSRSKPSGPRSKPEGSWSKPEGSRSKPNGSRSKPSGSRSSTSDPRSKTGRSQSQPGNSDARSDHPASKGSRQPSSRKPGVSGARVGSRTR